MNNLTLSQTIQTELNNAFKQLRRVHNIQRIPDSVFTTYNNNRSFYVTYAFGRSLDVFREQNKIVLDEKLYTIIKTDKSRGCVLGMSADKTLRVILSHNDWHPPSFSCPNFNGWNFVLVYWSLYGIYRVASIKELVKINEVHFIL